MIEKLYIIGNGFDLHHNLKTSYIDFARFLKANYPDHFELLEDYIIFPKSEKTLWKKFEENLASLDVDQIIDDNIYYLPDIASDNFRTGDLHAFPDTMANICESLTTELIDAFEEFILKVAIPKSAENRKIQLYKDAYFLNFNYTNTLEKFYDVSRKDIFYIHNSAHFGGKNIVLGHAIDPHMFEQDETPPDGLEPEELEHWYEQQQEGFDYSADTGRENIMAYFSKTYKPSKQIIIDNQEYFSQLESVKEIRIYGLSMSDVDKPYLEEIASKVNTSTKWIVSYYNGDEYKSHKETLEDLGIENYELIQLDDLVINPAQLKLNL